MPKFYFFGNKVTVTAPESLDTALMRELWSGFSFSASEIGVCYTDKPVTVCQELFEKIQIKKGVTTKPKSSNNFEC